MKTTTAWLSSLLLRLNAFVASRTFFYIIIGFLVVNSLWVALVSLYPMAFDENFHVGIIQLYANVWNPFSVTLPPDVNDLGAVTVDPSYLFHYLMSFPYRFVDVFTDSEAVIIIVLRLLNIAMFAASLFIYRKVLLAARVTPAVINVVMAVLVLIPVVPLLAGQVNYDNLIMLIVAAAFWFAYQIWNSLRTENHLLITPTIWLLVLTFLGAATKYAFLPIVVAVAVVLFIQLIIALTNDRAAFCRHLRTDAAAMSRPMVALLLAAVIVSGILFGQRYVMNVVNYGDFAPDCALILSTERCEEYGPWGRNHRYRQNKDHIETVSFPQYVSQYWAWGMWHRLYFTLAGPTNSYATRTQLPIPSTTAIALVGVGTLASIIYARRLLRNHPVFVMFILAGVAYVGILIVRLYGSYVDTGRPVAINGRYLIPLLPLLGAVGGMAIVYALRSLRLARYGGAVAIVALLLLLQGGGALTYIVYAETSWLWPYEWVQQAHESIQPIARWLIVER